MIKGLYKSASAMIPRIKKQEISSNNIANASTPGFKKDALFTKELSRAELKVMPKRNDWEQPMVDNVYTSFVPGVFDKTGNPLDLAIDGDGFFLLQLDDGNRALTRNGAFSVNTSGQLEFPGGALVLGNGGPIEIGSGQVEISATGIVSANGSNVGQITPVTVANLDELEKLGNSMFLLPEGIETTDVDKSTIQQGYLEASNVDIVREMIEMIISFRNFEADSKSIQVQDNSLEQLFSRVGGRR
ncbi:MAG: flagellar hook-basal body protein [Calditrichaeota bacterium]|nr:MAG: flagellar hook-basal body protein [Calditrichota bacterium]